MFFWIGKGVLTHKGKDYGFGQKLPESLPEETFKSLKKKGKIADKVPSAKSAAAISSDKELKNELRNLKGALDSANGTNDALQKKLDAAEETVGELTLKLTAADKINVEITGKIGDAEKNIAELTKQITKASK